MAAELAVMTQLKNDIADLQSSIDSLATLGSQIKSIQKVSFSQQKVESDAGANPQTLTETQVLATPITNIDKVVYHITPTSEPASNEAAPDTSVYPYRFFAYDRSDIFVHPLTVNLGGGVSNVESGSVKYRVLSSDNASIVADYTINRSNTNVVAWVVPLTLTVIEYA